MTFYLINLIFFQNFDFLSAIFDKKNLAAVSRYVLPNTLKSPTELIIWEEPMSFL